MTGLLDALEQVRPVGRRQLAAWAAREPELAGLDQAGLRAVLADRQPPVDYARKDALLAALIRLSRTDPSAGVELVSCLLPGVRSLLARHRGFLDPADASAVMVAGLWRRIAGYPLDRRPRRIAANLLLDALHDFIDVRHRQQVWIDHHRLSGDPGAEVVAPEEGWPPELVLDEACRAGILKAHDAVLIERTRLDGYDLCESGRAVGVAYAAARKRRRRAEQRLAAWWAPERWPMHANFSRSGDAGRGDEGA
jgi:hypothetical protein